ncbi:MAG TPA: hypothetical protein VIS76_03695 [Pseudomonadales bacterium]
MADTRAVLEASAARWFARLWSVAILAHLIGNPRVGQLWPNTTALGVTTALLGLIAAVLVVFPDDRRILSASAVGVLVVAWFEAPFIGNHWVVASFVSLAILFAQSRRDPWVWFSRTGRWILLGFYSWAAFNKLNAGFFDPDVSCGVVYANQWLEAAGLGAFAAGGLVGLGVAAGSALIELAVPVLLAIPRTRRWGVLLGFVFHGVISLDFGQHFYDFTALLLAMFTLFLPDDVLAALERRITAPRRTQMLIAAVPALLVLVSLGPMNAATVWLLTKGVFIVWIPFLLWALVSTHQQMRRRGDLDVDLRLRDPIAIGLVAIVVFNGLTPHLELKTGYGWNMYANLVTAQGESNHFVIRRTLPLTDVQERLAEVEQSNDPGLQAYIDSGYLLPERRLLHYLSDHRQTSVRYTVGAETIEGTGAQLGVPLPVLVEKWQLFRAVDARRPVRCQTTWLPAR